MNNIPTLHTPLEWALWLVEKYPGVKVHPIPLRNGEFDKGAKLTGWPALSSNDPDKIKTLAAQYPGCYWGAMGVSILDVDVKGEDGEGNPINGLDTLAALQKQGKSLPDTLRVQSPSGGEHIYLDWNDWPLPRETNYKNGLDLRGSGNTYVVAPDGVKYKVLSAPDKLGVAPQWLHDMTPATKTNTMREVCVPNLVPDLETDVNNFLAELNRLHPAITGQGGDNFTAKTVFPLTYDYGLSVEKAHEVVLSSDWNARCNPPWESAELMVKARSARKSPRANPIGCKTQAAREAAASQTFGPTGTTSSVPVIDIKGQIVDVLTNQNHTPTQKNNLVAKIVVDALATRGSFYYHAQHRDFATAMFFDGETKRLERVQSDAFVAWLSEWAKINRSAPVFRFVLSAVETASLSGPHTSAVIPESFWASRSGACYLSNGDGLVAKITANNVEPCDNGIDGVLFGAGATLPPWELVEPVDPFASCSLFAKANHADDHGAMLLKLWALSFATLPVCKPPFVLAGPIRSGKTRIVRGIAELYGLPQCVEEPSDTEKSQVAFWVNLDAGGVYALDNVDTRVAWLADAIASASTGAGVFPRKLYTDSGRVEMRPRAWLAVTTCNPTFAADAGLADRLLVARMNQRDGETSDEALSTEIAANRDAGLSWIAHTLAKAVADSAAVPSGLNRRHPDFAALAVRLGRALGHEQEAIAALRAAESDKARFCLENDPVGAALLAAIAEGAKFVGTAAKLLDILAQHDTDFSAAAHGPRGNRLWSAKRLGKRLAVLWPYIAEMFDTKRDKDRLGFTLFTIKPRGAVAVANKQAWDDFLS
ncbi:MAG: bifunctional DNA primase/polymerase [Verrucomicrobiia bacterium]